MIRRILIVAGRLARVPFRLVLGLPPFYGLTIKCWVLYLLRQAGLYRGTIHFHARVKTMQIRGL